MTTSWLILRSAALLVIGAWVVSRIVRDVTVRGTSGRSTARSIAYEIRPFVIPAAMLDAAASIALNGFTPTSRIFNAIWVALVVWDVWQDHDDDRWKRRGKKLLGRLHLGRTTAAQPGGAA